MSENTYLNNSIFSKSLTSNFNQKAICRIHRQMKKQYSISGVWSDQENMIYAQFIEDHPFQFQTAEKRRRFKVFQRMAMHLPNRTSIQCRSHNQKMVKLAGTIQNVPRYIKRRMCTRGRKIEEPIQIKDQQNEGSSSRLSQKPLLIKTNTDEIQGLQQPMPQKQFQLPLKLCIQIKSTNIEQY